ncbi:hypothetical protein MWU38_10495 [Qipengyuania sp. S6317L1]|uniref:hypothetical protein n=1 Tax=Qipengyuania sp. S6317L1 TaxID=2926410 RepID=UPI001FF38589|nr:hypothetical protein [Qipengyuania sp. S6317L1]MCK0099813.1 hypothetical protein [Qipengyuania sp. S6317L1]
MPVEPNNPKRKYLALICVSAAVVVGTILLLSKEAVPDEVADSYCDRSQPHALIDLRLPEMKEYESDVQLTITLPCRYIRDQYRYSRSFRAVNYKTGKVSDALLSEGDRDFVWFTVRDWAYPEEQILFQHWQAYEPNGEERHGLLYAPQIVPSRPENRWRIGFFKPDVSGREFHIWCPPEADGFAILPQEWCTMRIMLNPTEVRGRRRAVRVNATFRIERLDDWKEIEGLALEIFANTSLN